MIFSIAARHCVGVPSKYNGMANIKRLSIRTFSMLKKNCAHSPLKQTTFAHIRIRINN